MKRSLSPRLSPQAKRAALRATPEAQVRALVQVAAAADLEVLERALAGLGGRVVATLAETRMVSVELPAAALERAAELPGVVYIEAATLQQR